MERIVNPGEHFITFSYNGKDSSDFGIIAITNGGKYTLNLESDFTDSLQNTPGYDGVYYYGTQISGQTFDFNCFAHNLTINEYDALRSWLNPRTGGKLILADQPYKYYLVKIATIGKLNNIPLSNGSLDETVYTGDFAISFRTIGPAYGIGVAYYKDGLLYDTGLYYDSGLLYKDMSPILTYSIPSNTSELLLTLYNPGTAHNKPTFTVNLGSVALGNKSFLKVENKTLGTLCYIDVSGFKNEVVIDFNSQTVTYDSKAYYGRIFGQSLEISPKQFILELPETHDVIIENDELETHNTIYVESNVAYIDPSYLLVTGDLVGRYLCINNNGGAKILSVNTTDNSVTLDSTIRGGLGTYDIPRATETTSAGFACTYYECNGDIPETGTLGQVITADNKWYIYMYGQWMLTNLFSAKSDFYNEADEYETKYLLFGASILSLDNVVISTGTAVSFKRGSEQISGISMGAVSCEVAITPKYL